MEQKLEVANLILLKLVDHAKAAKCGSLSHKYMKIIKRMNCVA